MYLYLYLFLSGFCPNEMAAKFLPLCICAIFVRTYWVSFRRNALRDAGWGAWVTVSGKKCDWWSRELVESACIIIAVLAFFIYFSVIWQLEGSMSTHAGHKRLEVETGCWSRKATTNFEWPWDCFWKGRGIEEIADSLKSVNAVIFLAKVDPRRRGRRYIEQSTNY